MNNQNQAAQAATQGASKSECVCLALGTICCPLHNPFSRRTPAATTGELPPLPRAQYKLSPDSKPSLHDDDAMQNYARAAIEADRAQQAGAVAPRVKSWESRLVAKFGTIPRGGHVDREAAMQSEIADLRAQLARQGKGSIDRQLTEGDSPIKQAAPASAQPADNVRQALEDLCAALPDVLPSPAGDRYRVNGKWAQGNSYALRGHTATVTYRADDMACVYAALDAANAALLAHPCGAQPAEQVSDAQADESRHGVCADCGADTSYASHWPSCKQRPQQPAARVAVPDGDSASLMSALRELMSIVRIHSNATGENFAWAEMQLAQEALDNAASPATLAAQQAQASTNNGADGQKGGAE